MRNFTTNITFKILLLLPLSLLSSKGLSQDVQFSQFYSSPLYLNPAFAGSAHHYRFITQNRWQWPGQDAKYNTYSFTADTYFNKYKSGVGLMVTHDRQGSNSISSTDIQLLYSYELHLNEKLTVRAGFQAGFITRYIDANKQFTDQFSNNGYDANTPSGEELMSPRKNMLDLSSGLILYSRRIWAGLSANHLNTPNQSFYSGLDPSPLPMKFSIVGGYKIPLVHNRHMAYLENEKDISITPTFLYKFQGKSDQIDLGIYGQYDQLLIGIWYRGIPFKRYEDFQNNESIIPQIGWHFQNFSVAYSYDFVVSKLTGARPYGAHEINLTYIVIKRHKGAKPMKRLPCPHFYKN